MAKVQFKRVENVDDLDSIPVEDGNFVVTGDGKTYVDYGNERKGIGGTPDNEMSDFSTNSVENKVIKKYIDDVSEVIGSPDNLNTTDKSSIVNSINEVSGALNELFKFQYFFKPVVIGANGNIGTIMGALNVPDGYKFIGTLAINNGYGDQWVVTYAKYANNIVAYIASFYNGSLTSQLECMAVFIKEEYYNNNLVS